MNRNCRPVRVACVVDYYLPGFKGGGPIRTVENMVAQLSGDVEFWIVTRDRDLSSDQAYDNVQINAWNEVKGAKVFYADPENFSFRGIGRILAEIEYDVLYLNSFFSPRAAIYPLVLRMFGSIQRKPIVLAPRGEFSPGALGLKRFKKSVYLWFVKKIGLCSGVVWQASSEHELADIRNVFSDSASEIVIAADLLSMPEADDDSLLKPSVLDRKSGPLRAVFVSRLSPKKNLDYLLNVLGEVRNSIVLSIYGPAEDEAYWSVCQEKISSLPPNVEVKYFGGVTADKVPEIFSGNDVFAFPTRGENFGHVIFESLRSGTPVLISDQTPWAPTANGAVTIVPLDDFVGWVRSLDALAACDDRKHKERRAHAFSYALDYYKNNQARKANLTLFQTALGR